MLSRVSELVPCQSIRSSCVLAVPRCCRMLILRAMYCWYSNGFWMRTICSIQIHEKKLHHTHIILYSVCWTVLLQCFDAVGWAAGRASGLQKTEGWGAGVLICLEQGADLHTAQRIPLPLTVSCFSKIQTGFTSLLPAHPYSPGQRAVKRLCMCIHVTIEFTDQVLCQIISFKKSARCSRRTTMPAPHHCFLQAGCPSCRPTNSVKALKACIHYTTPWVKKNKTPNSCP